MKPLFNSIVTKETNNLRDVVHGDCLEVMKLIPSQSIDLIIADPPYGMSYKSGKWHGHYVRGKHRVIPKNISPILGDNDIVDFFEESHRILKEKGAIYVFGSWRTSEKWRPLIEKHFVLRNKLIWVKNNHTMGSWKHQYRNKYEEIFYADLGAHELRGPKGHADVLMFNRVRDSKRLHPAEKPVNLLEYLIKESSDPEAIVFDPFAGSGSTLVAAKNTNRRYLGIEIDKSYVDIANRRLNHEGTLC